MEEHPDDPGKSSLELDDLFGENFRLESPGLRLQTLTVDRCREILAAWSPSAVSAARFAEYLHELTGRSEQIGLDRHLPPPFLLSSHDRDEQLGLAAWVDWNLEHGRGELSLVASPYKSDADSLVKAVAGLISLGFNLMRMHRVESRPIAHAPELEVYRAAGMIHEATLTGAFRIGEEYHDISVLGLVATAEH